MQPRWNDPMESPEGELLAIIKSIERNIGCADTSNFKPNRGDEKQPDLPKSKKQKHNKPKMEKASCPCTEDGGTCSCSSECSKCKCNAIEKADTCRSCGYDGNRTGGMQQSTVFEDGKCTECGVKEGKIDKTTEFLESKGIMVKYEQEPDVTNSVPTFLDHSGGIPVEAIGGYHTNQTIPDFQAKAPKSTFITEKASIPSVSQTGYDEKGSSLHMHLNDQGGSSDYRATIEESMTQLKKAGGYNNPGLVEEIAAQVEELMGRLS